eukprot:scaffold2257_cov56-Attheya_sp.AAC.1
MRSGDRYSRVTVGGQPVSLIVHCVESMEDTKIPVDVPPVVTSKKKGRFWGRSDDTATKKGREKQKRRQEEQKKNKRKVKQRKKIRGKGKTEEQHVIELLRQSYLDSLDGASAVGGDVPRRVKTCVDDDNSSVTMSKSSVLNDLDDSSTMSLTLTGMDPNSIFEEPRRKSSRLAALLAYLSPILPMCCCAVYPEYVDRPIPRILSITSNIQDNEQGSPMKNFSASYPKDDDSMSAL